MTNEYYTYEDTKAWNSVGQQYIYFKNSEYSSGTVTLTATDDILSFTKSNNVRTGDLMYFDDNSDGAPNHAGIVYSVDNGALLYSGHTNDHIFENVTSYFNSQPSASIHIVIMR